MWGGTWGKRKALPFSSSEPISVLEKDFSRQQCWKVSLSYQTFVLCAHSGIVGFTDPSDAHLVKQAPKWIRNVDFKARSYPWDALAHMEICQCKNSSAGAEACPPNGYTSDAGKTSENHHADIARKRRQCNSAGRCQKEIRAWRETRRSRHTLLNNE